MKPEEEIELKKIIIIIKGLNEKKKKKHDKVRKYYYYYYFKFQFFLRFSCLGIRNIINMLDQVGYSLFVTLRDYNELPHK